MTNVVAKGGESTSGGSLSAAMALRLAWGAWLAMLVVPFLLFLCVVATLGIDETTTSMRMGRDWWFLSATIYLLIAVPFSFFWRSHMFRAYWSGQTVPPTKYLMGMLSMWVALEIGGLYSLVGCFVKHMLLPGLFPALLAFMFYVTLYPSGRAMFRKTGNVEDPQVYEEPR